MNRKIIDQISEGKDISHTTWGVLLDIRKEEIEEKARSLNVQLSSLVSEWNSQATRLLIEGEIKRHLHALARGSRSEFSIRMLIGAFCVHIKAFLPLGPDVMGEDYEFLITPKRMPMVIQIGHKTVDIKGKKVGDQSVKQIFSELGEAFLDKYCEHFFILSTDQELKQNLSQLGSRFLITEISYASLRTINVRVNDFLSFLSEYFGEKWGDEKLDRETQSEPEDGITRGEPPGEQYPADRRVDEIHETPVFSPLETISATLPEERIQAATREVLHRNLEGLSISGTEDVIGYLEKLNQLQDLPGRLDMLVGMDIKPFARSESLQICLETGVLHINDDGTFRFADKDLAYYFLADYLVTKEGDPVEAFQEAIRIFHKFRSEPFAHILLEYAATQAEWLVAQEFGKGKERGG